jgi:hypothetical protein
VEGGSKKKEVSSSGRWRLKKRHEVEDGNDEEAAAGDGIAVDTCCMNALETNIMTFGSLHLKLIVQVLYVKDSRLRLGWMQKYGKMLLLFCFIIILPDQ